MNLFPVVDFFVFGLAVVEGEDVHFFFVFGELSGEDLCDDESIGEVHLRIPDGVGEVETI